LVAPHCDRGGERLTVATVDWKLVVAIVALILTAVGVTVGIFAFRLHRRRDERERETERQRRENAQAEQQRFEAAFVGLSVEYEGERRHFVWDGPINLIQGDRPPINMTTAFEDWLREQIQRHDQRLQVYLSQPEDPRGFTVYERDADYAWKRRLHGSGRDAQYCLRAHLQP
jgi:hypothetical protein